MPDWSELTRVVDSTVDPRRPLPLDTFVFLAHCPAGHKVWAIGANADFRYADLDKMLQGVRKFPGAPCSTCKASSPPDGGETYFSTRLPGARRDLLVHMAGEQVSLALRALGGAPASITSDHPTLLELPLASALMLAIRSKGVGGPQPTPAEREAALAPILLQAPGYVPALREFGSARKERGDAAGALETFERALVADPDDPESHFLLADVLDETGDDARAIALYARCTALDPTHALAHSQRGLVLKRLGRLDEARAAYDAALAVDPHHAPTLLNVAIWAHNADDVDGVMRAVSLVSSRNAKSHPRVQERMALLCTEHGVAASRRGHWSEAGRWFGLLEGLQPDSASPLFNQAACAANVGALDEAIAYARRALAMEPGHERAKLLLAEAESMARAGFPDRLVTMRQERTIRYVDSHGRKATLLNFIVKMETTKRLVETEVARLSLRRDKDLLKLLAAKGHNARVGLAAEPPKSALRRLLSTAKEPLPTGEEGRLMAFVVDVEPEPDFLALARASSWITQNGVTIPSAPVPIALALPKGERALVTGAPGPAFQLDRTLAFDEGLSERFYPPAWAEYAD